MAGPRSKFWVPQARSQIRGIKRIFVICLRYEGKTYSTPVTAALPRFLVSEAKPFQKAGVEFAWPLYIKKGKVSVKVYICLFTCVVSRGVHLELKESLSV